MLIARIYYNNKLSYILILFYRTWISSFFNNFLSSFYNASLVFRTHHVHCTFQLFIFLKFFIYFYNLYYIDFNISLYCICFKFVGCFINKFLPSNNIILYNRVVFILLAYSETYQLSTNVTHSEFFHEAGNQQFVTSFGNELYYIYVHKNYIGYVWHSEESNDIEI